MEPFRLHCHNLQHKHQTVYCVLSKTWRWWSGLIVQVELRESALYEHNPVLEPIRSDGMLSNKPRLIALFLQSRIRLWSGLNESQSRSFLTNNENLFFMNNAINAEAQRRLSDLFIAYSPDSLDTWSLYVLVHMSTSCFLFSAVT